MSLTTASAKGLSDIIHHQFHDIPSYWKSRQNTITRALYSYSEIVDADSAPSRGNQITYITFKEGDYIDVQEVAANGWWYGHVVSNSDGALSDGWFPSNFVKPTASVDIPPAILERLSNSTSNYHCQVLLGNVCNTTHFDDLTWFSNRVRVTERRMIAAAENEDYWNVQQDTDIQCRQQTSCKREDGFINDKGLNSNAIPMSIDMQLLRKAQEALSKLQESYARSEISSYTDPVVQNTSQNTTQSMRLVVEAVNDFLQKLSVIPNLTDDTKSRSNSIDGHTMFQGGEEEKENQGWVLIR